MSAQKEAKKERERQRKHSLHQGNLQGQGKQKGEAAQILHALSDDSDLPIQPEDDPVIGQWVSKVTSTANLSEEQTRSIEWEREIQMTLRLCQYPTEDGVHGSWRGWVHGDEDKALEPIDQKTRATWESEISSSKLALSRSKDAKVIEEGSRDVSESIVSDPDSDDGRGGLLGKLGL